MRHLRLPLVLAVAAAVAAALPSPASASRPATAAEMTALTAALAEPAPAHCFSGEISTVDGGWAALRPAAAPVGCAPANGVLVLRDEGGTWQLVLGDSVDATTPCRFVADVPPRIAADLGLCTLPSRKVYAAIFDRSEVRPRRLPWGAHAFVDAIRWRSWGGATAVGRGTFDYADRYSRFKIAVRVRLERRRLCGNRRTYLSQRIEAIRARDAKRIRYLRGPYELGCPNGR